MAGVCHQRHPEGPHHSRVSWKGGEGGMRHTGGGTRSPLDADPKEGGEASGLAAQTGSAGSSAVCWPGGRGHVGAMVLGSCLGARRQLTSSVWLCARAQCGWLGLVGLRGRAQGEREGCPWRGCWRGNQADHAWDCGRVPAREGGRGTCGWGRPAARGHTRRLLGPGGVACRSRSTAPLAGVAAWLRARHARGQARSGKPR